MAQIVASKARMTQEEARCPLIFRAWKSLRFLPEKTSCGGRKIASVPSAKCRGAQQSVLLGATPVSSRIQSCAELAGVLFRPVRCAATFGKRIRRHHCRMCGKCVCKQCSSHKLLLRHSGKPRRNAISFDRACDVCFTQNKQFASSRVHLSSGTVVLGESAT